jgi:hypothetical protein
MRFISTQQFRLAGIITASMLAGGLMTGTAMAYQGHMFSALHELQSANYQLSLAAADKGGYRLQAISLVNQAIRAVHAGIAAGS